MHICWHSGEVMISNRGVKLSDTVLMSRLLCCYKFYSYKVKYAFFYMPFQGRS